MRKHKMDYLDRRLYYIVNNRVVVQSFVILASSNLIKLDVLQLYFMKDIIINLIEDWLTQWIMIYIVIKSNYDDFFV